MGPWQAIPVEVILKLLHLGAIHKLQKNEVRRTWSLVGKRYTKLIGLTNVGFFSTLNTAQKDISYWLQ
jgi:hypothetical protein